MGGGLRRFFFGGLAALGDKFTQTLELPLVLGLSPLDSVTADGDSFDFGSGSENAFLDTDEDFSTIVNGSSTSTVDKFSVSFWMKWDTTPAQYDHMIGTSDDWDNWNDGWGVHWTGSTSLRFWINGYADAGQYADATGLTGTNWNHVVCTFDKDQGTSTDRISVYVNGSRGTDGTGSSANTNADEYMFIGRNCRIDGNNNVCDGLLAEISVWNGRLTPSEVTTLYNGGVPTILTMHSFGVTLRQWLRATSYSGGTATDQSGNSYDATDTGSPAVGTDATFPS